MVDLGYNGNPFTWSNERDGDDNIKERLDRVLANQAWLDHYPDTQVYHLPKTHSDHCPLLISTSKSVSNGPFPFRCKECWLDHPDFHAFFCNNWNVDNLHFLPGHLNFINNIKNWNTNVFGNIDKQKKIIKISDLLGSVILFTS